MMEFATPIPRSARPTLPLGGSEVSVQPGERLQEICSRSQEGCDPGVRGPLDANPQRNSEKKMQQKTHPLSSDHLGIFLGDFLWDFYGFLLDFYGSVQAMEKRLAEATKRLAPLRKFRQAGSFGGFNGNLWWFFMGSFMDFFMGYTRKLWKTTQIP